MRATIEEKVVEIKAAGGRAIAMRGDLSDEAGRVRLVAEPRASLGPITILVNNAAFTVPGTPSRPRPAQAAPSASAAPAEKPSWPSVATTSLRAYRRLSRCCSRPTS
jgi:NAD(P)-dependent dehydrogenase (short-subunit alcohol dehydrogenase family)